MNDVEQLLLTLKNATSNDTNKVSASSQVLTENEGNEGFHFKLLNISLGAIPNVDVNIRWLAVLCLKNGAERHWRTHCHSPMSESEKNSIRAEILRYFDENIYQVALQFAVIVSKIARYDYPKKWPQLLPILVSAMENLQPECLQLRDNTILLTFRYVMKELSTKRLPNDQKLFQQLSANTFPCCFAVWERFHKASVEAFTTSNVKQADVTLLMEKLINILKSFRVMSPLLSVENNQSLFNSVMCSLQTYLGFAESVSPNSTKYYETFHKLLVLHMKLLLDGFEFSKDAIHSFSKDIINLSKQCIYLHTQKRNILCERFVVNCMNVTKMIASNSSDKASISEEEIIELLKFLVFSFLPMTHEDLESWENDVEEFCSEEIGETWRYNLRASTEVLFLTFLHRNSEQLVPVVLSTVQSVNEKMRQDLQPNMELGSILTADAVLTAAGLACNEMFDCLDFEDWFQNHLYPYVQKCVMFPNGKIIHRRVLWLIEQWMGVKPPNSIQTTVYEFIISSLSDQLNLAVRLAACSALRQVLDDIEFDLDLFSPYQERCTDALYTLLQDVDSGDAKMRVLHVFSFVIERLGTRVISCAHKLSEVLPSIWQSSESHNMLRCAVVSTLINVVVGLKGRWSSPLQTFLFNVIHVCTDTTSQAHVYLLDDGLELWLALIHNTEKMNEQLLQLFNNIYQLLDLSSESVKACLEIVECYAVLGGETFIGGSHGTDLALAINSLIVDVRDECLTMVAHLMETMIRIAPNESSFVFQKYIGENLRFVLCNNDGTPLSTARLLIVARLAFQNTAGFWDLLKEHAGDRMEEAIGQFFQIVNERIDCIVETEQRKIVAIACLSTLEYFENSRAVQSSLSTILHVCLQVLYDVCDEDHVDTVVITHDKTDTVLEEEWDNFHSLRMRQLCHSDPNHRLSLPELTKNRLQFLSQLCGGQERFNALLFQTVDSKVLEQLQEFL